MPPKFSTPTSPPAVVSSSVQGQGHVNLTGSQGQGHVILTGSQAPTENGPRMVLTEVANVNGPATSLPSSIAPPGSPHEESLFRLDKTNKWEDFNSDEEKRGTHAFFRAPK